MELHFANTPRRLRQSFFERFTHDPQRILPGTQMPQYGTENGKSTVSDILDGDADEQFNAIWYFMRALTDADDHD